MTGTIVIPERASAPNSPDTDERRLYPKSDGWYDQDDTGANRLINSRMQLISEVILSSTAATVEFANIPQIYRHLKLMITGRTDDNVDAIGIVSARYNDDSGTNYSRQILLARGATVNALTIDGLAQGRLGDIATNFGDANRSGSIEATIFHYARTDFQKTHYSVSIEFGAISTTASHNLELNNVLWKNTAAITKITILEVSGFNFVAGSIFELWGIF